MSNWELLLEEKRKYKDTLVLDCFDLVIFRDIIDWEDDYYYLYERLNWEKYESSAVIWFSPLKGRLSKEEYERLERLWDFNTWWTWVKNDFQINIKNNQIEITGNVTSSNFEIILSSIHRILNSNDISKEILLNTSSFDLSILSEFKEFATEYFVTFR